MMFFCHSDLILTTNERNEWDVVDHFPLREACLFQIENDPPPPPSLSEIFRKFIHYGIDRLPLAGTTDRLTHRVTGVKYKAT